MLLLIPVKSILLDKTYPNRAILPAPTEKATYEVNALSKDYATACRCREPSVSRKKLRGLHNAATPEDPPPDVLADLEAAIPPYG